MALVAGGGPAVAFIPSRVGGGAGTQVLHRRPTTHSAVGPGLVAAEGDARPAAGRLLPASLAAAGLHLASRRRRGARRAAPRSRGRSPVQRPAFLLGGALERLVATEGARERERKTDAASASDLQSMWGLHSLTDADREQLRGGLPVQKQEREGTTGSGMVVFEVDAPPSVVFDCLESFENYPDMIPVVRQVEVLSRTRTAEGTLARLNYRISKFWLNLSVVHTTDTAAGLVRFDLDESCSKLVLRKASGFWQVEQADGHPDRTRVWLRASLRASSLLPHWIVDYAAARALKRATSWLRPYTESIWRDTQLCQLWKEEWTEDERFQVQVPGTIGLQPSMA